jgi:hypothetical protein
MVDTFVPLVNLALKEHVPLFVDGCKLDGMCFDYASCLRNYTRDHPLVPSNPNGNCAIPPILSLVHIVNILRRVIVEI